VLRLGAYQLLEMASVPAYAAVSQSVELVRAAGQPRAAGFVNGVLQAFVRRGAAIDWPSIDEDALGHLTTWGSHPAWLVERWLARFGVNDTCRLVAANNERPVLYLRPVGMKLPDALTLLRQAGIGCAGVPLAPDALRLDDATDLVSALDAIPAIVQDPAAGLVVSVAAADAGEVVADLCAAPGGKAIGLAAGQAGTGRAPRMVVAADLGMRRMRRLRENVERLRMQQVALVVADARRPPIGVVDTVLIDAPCTGTGTLRRHPDGKWRIGTADLEALAALQHELLDAAAPCIRPGGTLVYSTCSLEQEENEVQVKTFLSRHADFVQVPVGGVDPALTEAAHLYVLPQRHGFDGAFAATLRRRDA
jgi:16S rRNA (cytosine967-C5)-methyltransferase